jgi:hypothetical protein
MGGREFALVAPEYMLASSGLAPTNAMHRSTVRILTFIVLVLLGAPVAMHVVVHDLDEHHDAGAATAMIEHGGHGDHEHPIVGSSAPQVSILTRAALPVATTAGVARATSIYVARANRNIVSHGSLRMDDDVGLQPLLSTFLI